MSNKMKMHLSFEQVDKLLRFDWKTGQLVWRIDVPGSKAEEVAGDPSHSGHLKIPVAGKVCKANKLVWLLMTESWPSKELQHVDGNNANHHFENLRIAV